MWLYALSDEYKGRRPVYDDVERPFATALFQRSSGRKIPQETVNEAFVFFDEFLSGGDEEEVGIEELAGLSVQDAVDLGVSQYIGLYPSATEQQKEDFKAAIGRTSLFYKIGAINIFYLKADYLDCSKEN